MNKKMKVKPMFASKKKLPKFADGLVPEYLNQQAYGLTGATPTSGPNLTLGASKLASGTATSIGAPKQTIGISNATLGGVGNIATGVGSMLKNDDASSVGSYAGDMLSSAGQGASMGAALGPIGAGVGAVAGGIYGFFNAADAQKKQEMAQRKEAINTTLSANQDVSGNVNAQYNLRNFANDRVPGLNKGTVRFKSNQQNPNQPNAMVAGQEGIMDGQTGRVSTVPGQYSTTNPDVIPANLTEGSSVFSNKKSQTLPGGRSTPADIIARTEKMQKINDKILNPKDGDRKLSRLDQLTAKLNQSNIQKQANNLNKFNALVNPQQSQGNLPGYDNGIVDTATNDRLNKLGSEISTTQPVDPITGEVVYTKVPIRTGETMAKNAVPYLNDLATKTWGGKYNFGTLNGSLDQSLAGYYAGEINKQDPKYKVGSSTGYQAGKYKIPLSKSQADKYRIGDSPATVLQEQQTTSAPAVNAQDAKTQIDQSYINNIKTTQDKLNPNAPSKIDFNSIGNKLMSLAPIAYNARNSSPEVASPMYQDYMNPNQRYNIAPELAESTKQRQMSRYANASINTGTGANMAYGADAYSRGSDQLSGLMGKAQLANAGYREDYANRYNQNVATNTAEDKRIYDVNARNRAAARTFGSKNAEMLSQYAQVNQLMGNQKKADVLNSNIWQAYSSAVSPEQKAYLQSLISQYTK